MSLSDFTADGNIEIVPCPFAGCGCSEDEERFTMPDLDQLDADHADRARNHADGLAGRLAAAYAEERSAPADLTAEELRVVAAEEFPGLTMTLRGWDYCWVGPEVPARHAAEIDFIFTANVLRPEPRKFEDMTRHGLLQQLRAAYAAPATEGKVPA